MDNLNNMTPQPQPVNPPVAQPAPDPVQSATPPEPVAPKQAVAKIEFLLMEPVSVNIDTNIGSYMMSWAGTNTFRVEFSDNKTAQTFSLDVEADDLSAVLYEELSDVITKKVEKYMKKRFNEIQKRISEEKSEYIRKQKEIATPDATPGVIPTAPAAPTGLEEVTRPPEGHAVTTRPIEAIFAPTSYGKSLKNVHNLITDQVDCSKIFKEPDKNNNRKQIFPKSQNMF